MLNKDVIGKCQCTVSSGSIGIDKVSIGLPLGLPPDIEMDAVLKSAWIIEYAKSCNELLYHVQDTLINVLESKGKRIKGKAALWRYPLIDQNNQHISTILLGRTPQGVPVLNFEFNPSLMSFANWQELSGLLDLLLYGGFEELYAIGVVSHMEFFIDLEGGEQTELVMLSLTRRSHSQFKTSQYRGRRGSKLVGTIYNKGAQMKLSAPRTRIEIRINRRDLKFWEIVEMEVQNPFEQFVVVPKSALENISDEWNVPTLGNALLEFGLFDGVANKFARNAIANRLQENVIQDWQPDKLWAGFKGLLDEFKPSNELGFSDEFAPLYYSWHAKEYLSH